MELTATDIRTLRAAENVELVHDGEQSFIFAHLAAGALRVPVGHILSAPGIGGATPTAFFAHARIAGAQFHDLWRTAVASLRPGDTLRLTWTRGAAIPDTRLACDTVALRVNRLGAEAATYHLTMAHALIGSAARMVHIAGAENTASL